MLRDQTLNILTTKKYVAYEVKDVI
jgi:hypothetical protein